jgi:hypothetical protein
MAGACGPKTTQQAAQPSASPCRLHPMKVEQ